MRKEKLVLFILMAAFVVSSYAQNFEEQREERLKIYKASKKKNKDKALILSEEDAEQLLNDGWKTTPSALPLERQMDAMCIMQMEYDSKLFPAYVMAEANSVNQDYNAAKKRAVELAKSVLVEKIQSEISLQTAFVYDIAQIVTYINNKKNKIVNLLKTFIKHPPKIIISKNVKNIH